MHNPPIRPKYRWNIRAIINSRLRILLRKLLKHLPDSVSGRHYLMSLLKYDRRAGSYVELYRQSLTMETSPMCLASFDGEITEMKYKTVNDAHLNWLANTIIEERLENVSSIIEIGAGELTTIAPIKNRLKNQNIQLHASELSWSRLHMGRTYFCDKGINLKSLSSASVLELPYRDGSFDCVLSHYFLEELVGYQEQAIRELLRISKKYVILVEASYELGNKYQRWSLFNRRWNMEIVPAIQRNKWRVIEYSLVPHCDDAYHHGAIHILESEFIDPEIKAQVESPEILCCPKCKGSLNKHTSFLKCNSCSLVFPVLDDIPIMLSGNAIVASKFET